ncbi:hypothetical protein MTO96_043906, partial [Rhipicephalus appendiculatus]
ESGEGSSKTAAGKPATKAPAKPVAKASGSKASDAKSPTKGGGRVAEKGQQEQGMRKGGQKDKGWCTVCEIHFEGSFLDHRRTEDHKVGHFSINLFLGLYLQALC